MGAATIRQLTTAGHTVTNLSRGGTLTSGGLPRPSLPEGIRCLMCDRATDGTELQVHPISKTLVAHKFDGAASASAESPRSPSLVS